MVSVPFIDTVGARVVASILVDVLSSIILVKLSAIVVISESVALVALSPSERRLLVALSASDVTSDMMEEISSEIYEEMAGDSSMDSPAPEVGQAGSIMVVVIPSVRTMEVDS